MRVSVIMTMEASPVLRAESALAFALDAGPTPVPEPAVLDGLVIDPTFRPLPIASLTPDAITLAAASLDTAPAFVTRGTIEVEHIEEVPHERDGVKIFADPEVGLFAPNCPSGAVGSHLDVARLLDSTALAAKRLDGKGVAVAIMDTGINLAHLRGLGLRPSLDRHTYWAPPGVSGAPGRFPTDHGTMCAFDALIAAPRCTLLDFPILRSRTPGGSVMSGFLSDALLAFSYLRGQMALPEWKYRALVINNSWGMYHPSWDFPPGHPGCYSDNPAHPFNIIVGTVARAGADILFAAGNCGADCPDGRCLGVTSQTISGANAHPDVLTLAACDIHGSRLGYSSQGPGIAGMAANKPDLTAYSHFRGSEAFGPAAPDSGTSTACPVAAGVVAALRTRLAPSKVPPNALFSQVIAGAAPAPGTLRGWNPDYGAGIIDALAVASHFGL